MARVLQATHQGSGIAPGAVTPTNEPSGTDAADATKDDPDLGATVVDPVAAAPNNTTPSTDAVAPVSDPVAAVPNEVAPVPDPVAPLPGAGAPLPGAGAPVPNLAGPISSVTALGPDMLSALVGAVLPLTQLPSDLNSLLVGIAGVQPLVARAEADSGPGWSPAAAASVASRLPLGLSLAGTSGAPFAGASGLPVTGETTGATLDVTALSRASAASGITPPAPDAAFPIGAGSSFPRVLGAILIPLSLWALAAAALPGAGGLGLVTLAGVRLGYRQAKAGVAVRTTGLAHFARQGPLGIVRSGSLVVVRPRALRALGTKASTGRHLLDEVA